jgi:glycosyltransferase involved in cell wall biosynthesis
MTIILEAPPHAEHGPLPEMSILIPALNEEITIGEFIESCWLGLAAAHIRGEIIIIDSSCDATPRIALEKGARVLHVPQRGLGQAYKDALPFVRAPFILMGDCDLTYDFKEISPFIRALREGNDFVMGSRLRGAIEKGAMPALHRYFGIPITTHLLNYLYGSHYTDIHCGMRAITKEAFCAMKLSSPSWEYASEMVLKAVQMNLRISEVPISFYKDREGRQSHHKRSGFLSPWRAGWSNLKVMLTYAPDLFLVKPGIFFSVLGLVIVALSVPYSLSLGPLGFGVHSFLLGITAIILGNSLFLMGLIADGMNLFSSEKYRAIKKIFSYNGGMSLALISFVLGLGLCISFVINFIETAYPIHTISRSALLGLLCLVLAIQFFTFTLVFELGQKMKSGG